MKKLSTYILLFITSITFSAYSDSFCSLNCQTPQQKAPQLRTSQVEDFAGQGALVYQKGETLKIVLPSDKFFLAGTPTLRDDKLKTMKNISDVLKNYGPQATVEILAYTDATASDEQSGKESLAKAQSVAAYLWAQGLDPEHFFAVGLGKKNLVGDTQDLVANAANRRVEIFVKTHCTDCF